MRKMKLSRELAKQAIKNKKLKYYNIKVMRSQSRVFEKAVFIRAKINLWTTKKHLWIKNSKLQTTKKRNRKCLRT